MRNPQQFERLPPPLPPPTPVRASRHSKARFARWINLFCPGLGQILIGRWRIGLVQLMLFLLSAAVSMGLGMLEIVRIYLSVIHAANDPRAHIVQPDYARLGWALFALGVAVSTQLWSVWDAGKQSGTKRLP